jgi:MFS family permease
MIGAALVAAGFADYPLIAFHFSRSGAVPSEWIAIFYAAAMAVSGMGSLVLGRLFDRFGFTVLTVLTLVSAAFAPLVFFGGFWAALVGAVIWGLGLGAHESIISAAIAPMAWVHMNRSYRRRSLRWSPHADGHRRLGHSPQDTACSGFWGAP